MRKIEGIPNYTIYFDNVRVDSIVTSFSTNTSIDGGMGQASIQMVYLEDMDMLKTRSNYIKDEGSLISIVEAVSHMTNVKIFIKNVFNNLYYNVFDGNIKGKNITKNPGGKVLTYFATDHMTWLNQTIVPMTIPYILKLPTSERLKWEAQGIDFSKSETFSSNYDIDFKRQSLQQIVKALSTQAFEANMTYQDARGVGYWDDAMGRIDLMGDINAEIRREGILDLKIDPQAISVDSLYVYINDIVKRLMFEFFQDRDGVIRIKPPFWGEPVLKSHVLDKAIITNYSEHTDWSSLKTRTATISGLEDWQEQRLTEIKKKSITNLGVYLGDNLWLDNTDGFIKDNSTTPGVDVNPLMPTLSELTNGPNIQMSTQPMIRPSVAAAFISPGEDSQDTDPQLLADVLKAYSKLMHNMVNASVYSGQVSLIGSPQIRPGFNVWIDPIGEDKIYYVNSVSHSGSASAGVETSLGLTHGRLRKDFVTDKSDTFAVMGTQENLFASKMNKHSGDFGEILAHPIEYDSIRNNLRNFHMVDGPPVKATDCYLTKLYADPNNDKQISSFSEIKKIDNGNTTAKIIRANVVCMNNPPFDYAGAVPQTETTTYRSDIEGNKIFTVLSEHNGWVKIGEDEWVPREVLSIQNNSGIIADDVKRNADKYNSKKFPSYFIDPPSDPIGPATGKLTDVLFTKGMPLGEVEGRLNWLYGSRAPGVVKVRARKIRACMNASKKSATLTNMSNVMSYRKKWGELGKDL